MRRLQTRPLSLISTAAATEWGFPLPGVNADGEIFQRIAYRILTSYRTPLSRLFPTLLFLTSHSCASDRQENFEVSVYEAETRFQNGFAILNEL